MCVRLFLCEYIYKLCVYIYYIMIILKKAVSRLDCADFASPICKWSNDKWQAPIFSYEIFIFFVFSFVHHNFFSKLLKTSLIIFHKSQLFTCFKINH